MVDVADQNRRLPRTAQVEGGSIRTTRDQLTERHARAAARAALDLPVAHRGKAFALGLAVAVGDTDELGPKNLMMSKILGGDRLPRWRLRQNVRGGWR